MKSPEKALLLVISITLPFATGCDHSVNTSLSEQVKPSKRVAIPPTAITKSPPDLEDSRREAELGTRGVRARERWAQGDRDGVLAEMREVYRARDDSPIEGLALARALVEAGERTEAMTIYREIVYGTKWVGTHSRNPRTLLEYADLLRKARRAAEAEGGIALTGTRYEGPSNVRAMRKRGPNSGWTEVSYDEATLNVLAAKECTMRGEYEEAEAYANTALRLRPNDPEAKRWIKTARNFAAVARRPTTTPAP